MNKILPKYIQPANPVKVGGKRKKQKIPVALREAVWIKQCGRSFEHACSTPWCENTISVFDFQCGHNVPESKGGPTILANLVPLCARCNVSMGDRFTFDEWVLLSMPAPRQTDSSPPPARGGVDAQAQPLPFFQRLLRCFYRPRV